MSCSRQLLFATNALSLLVGAGSLGVAFFLRAVSPVQRPFLQTVPTFALDAAIYASVLVLIVATLGLVGVQRNSSAAMYVYMFLTSVTFLVTALGAVVISLVANGISVGPLDGLVASGGVLVQQQAIRSAVSDPTGFKLFQDSLECCGITMATAYVSINGKAAGLPSLSQISTGARCSEGSASMAAILADFPPDPEGGVIPTPAQNAADTDPTIGRGTGFFCLSRIGDQIANNAVPFIVTCAVLAVVQLLNIRAAFVVLYRVPKSLGGFALQEFKRPAIEPAPTAFGRLSQAIVNNDFFRPPPRPAAELQPNFFQDARAFGARASAAFFGGGQEMGGAAPIAPYRMSLMQYQTPQITASKFGNFSPELYTTSQFGNFSPQPQQGTQFSAFVPLQ
jgi:hypothetical protein